MFTSFLYLMDLHRDEKEIKVYELLVVLQKLLKTQAIDAVR